MEKHQTLLSIILIVIVISTVSTGVAAQQQTRQLPLDDQPSELATVHTSGETYTVYEYNNILPYASGIEVYANGERVTSQETVDKVFQALARRKATKFQPERTTIERLHDVIDQSQQIESAVNRSLGPVNDTIALKWTLKTTQIQNKTAWEIATDQSTQLDRVLGRSVMGPSHVKTHQDQLLKLRDTATSLETNSERVITILERRQAGEEINQSDLYRRYDAVHVDLTDIRRQAETSRESSRQISTASTTVASETRGLDPVETNVSHQFTELGRTLETTADSFASTRNNIAQTHQSLPQVTTNQQYQSQLTKRWEERKSATSAIWLTFAEIIVGFVAAGLTIIDQQSL